MSDGITDGYRAEQAARDEEDARKKYLAAVMAYMVEPTSANRCHAVAKWDDLRIERASSRWSRSQATGEELFSAWQATGALGAGDREEWAKLFVSAVRVEDRRELAEIKALSPFRDCSITTFEYGRWGDMKVTGSLGSVIAAAQPATDVEVPSEDGRATVRFVAVPHKR